MFANVAHAPKHLHMKILLLIYAFFFFIYSATSQQERKLVWQEEFNYTGLPDPKKWTYEEGFIRNQERQYYTVKRKENVYVHNGMLEIKGRKENHANTQFEKGSSEWRKSDSLAYYTSGSINTLGKASWKYGRIEVRAKIPHGMGVWPAVWMMGINRSEVQWPACGEIDIMEFVGHDSTHIFGTIHYPKDGAQNGHGSSHEKIEVEDPYNNFHVYAMEWDSSQIKVFFDDQVYHSFQLSEADSKNDNAFRKPFYLLLNLALGGAWGGPIDDKILPQSYFVDYVRVYQ